MRPSGSSSSNGERGRGQTPKGRNNILAQIGNKKLTDSNITQEYASVSKINTEPPMYTEFMNLYNQNKLRVITDHPILQLLLTKEMKILKYIIKMRKIK